MNAENDAHIDHHEQARSKNGLVGAQNFLQKVSLFGVRVEGHAFCNEFGENDGD